MARAAHSSAMHINPAPEPLALLLLESVDSFHLVQRIVVSGHESSVIAERIIHSQYSTILRPAALLALRVRTQHACAPDTQAKSFILPACFVSTRGTK